MAGEIELGVSVRLAGQPRIQLLYQVGVPEVTRASCEYTKTEICKQASIHLSVPPLLTNYT